MRVLLAIVALGLTTGVVQEAAAQGAILDRRPNTMNDLGEDHDDRECAAKLLSIDSEVAASNAAMQAKVAVAPGGAINLTRQQLSEQELYYAEKALKQLKHNVCRAHRRVLGKDDMKARETKVDEIRKACVAIANDCTARKHW